MRRRGVLVLSALVVFAHAASLSAQAPPSALSAAEVAVACAPSLTVVPDRAAVHSLRIAGSQDTVPRTLFGNLELVVISGGTRNGIQLGQQYTIRRAYVFGRPSEGQLQTIHTTGWLRVVGRKRHDRDRANRARLRRRRSPAITWSRSRPHRRRRPATASGATPISLTLGRVIFGDQERAIAGPGDFMMLERGRAPLAAGTRVAVYRDLHTPGIPLTAVGEGVIVSVGDTQLLRVTAGRDAIAGGDYVAPRR